MVGFPAAAGLASAGADAYRTASSRADAVRTVRTLELSLSDMNLLLLCGVWGPVVMGSSPAPSRRNVRVPPTVGKSRELAVAKPRGAPTAELRARSRAGHTKCTRRPSTCCDAATPARAAR